MPIAEIIVLANSKKWGGRCVAGVSTQEGRWVRPVSGGPHGALHSRQYRVDGHDLRLLDVVGFEHDGPIGDPSQPENIEVGDSRWWLTGTIDPVEAGDRLAPHLVNDPALLGNRGSAVPETEASKGVDASLALIQPAEIEFCLAPPLEGTSKLRPRARFGLGDQHYDLALTDFLIRPRLLKAGLGTYDLAELGLNPTVDVLFTISLAEAREDWCVKLVAGVLTLPRG